MMILSSIEDKRIKSTNYLLQTTFSEYLDIANGIIDNNDLQRRRVKTSKTIYSLLKNDLIEGCVMPSIVLAYLGEDLSYNPTAEEIQKLLLGEKEKVIILDGLQRTYTLMDALEEVDNAKKADFLNNPIRIELYVNINRIGVLYRMLTLNTGQTPMSTRHQLEMLYCDLLNTEIENVKLVADTDGKANPDANEFIFRNAIDGFNSFMTRDELPMDRIDILENIKMLETLSVENVNQDVFRRFIEIYFHFFSCVKNITEEHILADNELTEKKITSNIIGKSASKVFASSQAMTGFGAAVGIMKDREVISSIEDIENSIIELEQKGEKAYEWLIELVQKVSELSKSAKKIGNEQRLFFVYFYRELFNRGGDSYLDFSEAIKNGYKKFRAQV